MKAIILAFAIALGMGAAFVATTTYVQADQTPPKSDK